MNLANPEASLAGALSLHVRWSPGANPRPLREKEWLVTDGLGGYASGTLLGENSRRYHGLFVPNLPSPRGRTIMLARCDETLVHDSQAVQISGAEYVDGHRDGSVEKYLQDFHLEWGVPTWTFSIDGYRIRKRIVMPHGHEAVCIEYELLTEDAVELHLRPFLTFRGHEAPLIQPHSLPVRVLAHDHKYSVDVLPGAPTLTMCFEGSPHRYVAAPQTSENVYYRIEQQRGLDYIDTLYSPGYFSLLLKRHQPLMWVTHLDLHGPLPQPLHRMIDREQERLQHVLSLAAVPAQTGWAAHLTLAADQFIVEPGARVTENSLLAAPTRPPKSVIAGYHWFTDWGRDTMISLEGLTLCTGRYEEAKTILHTFAKYVHKGLLPNHFPEGQPSALYHTLDASLWFFHAIDRYMSIAQDPHIVKELFLVLHHIITTHIQGTSFGIGVDPEDGLLRGSAPYSPLTWMDAQVDGYVVTPRRGKPVEIQALWFNALRLMRQWAQRLGQPYALYEDGAQRAQKSFHEKFWNPEEGCLYDYINEEGVPDPAIRPNQLFPISLAHPILHREYWGAVLGTVQKHLWTPYGIRTLDPRHPDYQPLYEGNRRARDEAYHQGMVWAWLMGPFLDAWMKVYGDAEKALTLLSGFESHLLEAGVGSISEIFDGEGPHVPRGCIAQAWSVAEVLRLWCNLKRASPVS